MHKYKLQPKEAADMTLPYPYFIDEKGFVGRQDFWKGKPKKLLGFSSVPKAGDMELVFKDFVKDPQVAVGMFPVFLIASSGWVTHTTPIESVKEIE